MSSENLVIASSEPVEFVSCYTADIGIINNTAAANTITSELLKPELEVIANVNDDVVCSNDQMTKDIELPAVSSTSGGDEKTITVSIVSEAESEEEEEEFEEEEEPSSNVDFDESENANSEPKISATPRRPNSFRSGFRGRRFMNNNRHGNFHRSNNLRGSTRSRTNSGGGQPAGGATNNKSGNSNVSGNSNDEGSNQFMSNWGYRSNLIDSNGNIQRATGDLKNYIAYYKAKYYYYFDLVNGRYPQFVRKFENNMEIWRMSFNVYASGFSDFIVHLGEIHAFYQMEYVENDLRWVYKDFNFYPNKMRYGFHVNSYDIADIHSRFIKFICIRENIIKRFPYVSIKHKNFIYRKFEENLQMMLNRLSDVSSSGCDGADHDSSENADTTTKTVTSSNDRGRFAANGVSSKNNRNNNNGGVNNENSARRYANNNNRGNNSNEGDQASVDSTTAQRFSNENDSSVIVSSEQPQPTTTSQPRRYSNRNNNKNSGENNGNIESTRRYSNRNNNNAAAASNLTEADQVNSSERAHGGHGGDGRRYSNRNNNGHNHESSRRHYSDRNSNVNDSGAGGGHVRGGGGGGGGRRYSNRNSTITSSNIVNDSESDGIAETGTGSTGRFHGGSFNGFRRRPMIRRGTMNFVRRAPMGRGNYRN